MPSYSELNTGIRYVKQSCRSPVAYLLSLTYTLCNVQIHICVVRTPSALFFKARYCCVPDAKPHLNCSHPAKVLSVSADNFKAQCSDKSVWDIEIQSKRTGFNPKGNWAASGASAAAFEASDEDL